MTTSPQYLSAIAGDIAGAFQIPGGNVLGLSIQNLFEKRIKRARDILIGEIRSGDKDVYEASDADEIVAIVYRYMRAAQEGTARINLRLLAQIIAGQKKVGALKASDFLYYADMIASLRREEIVLLGGLQRELNNARNNGAENPVLTAYEAAKGSLIPSVFSSLSEFIATATAVGRTGLLIYSNNTLGPTCFLLTPLFEQVNRLASFESTIEEKESSEAA